MSGSIELASIRSTMYPKKGRGTAGVCSTEAQWSESSSGNGGCGSRIKLWRNGNTDLGEGAHYIGDNESANSNASSACLAS